MRVHDVDLRDVDRARVRRQQIADLLLGGAVLAAEVQVEARDVVRGLATCRLGDARFDAQARSALGCDRCDGRETGAGGLLVGGLSEDPCARSSPQTSQNSFSAGGGSLRNGAGAGRSGRRGPRSSRGARSVRGPRSSRGPRSVRGPRLERSGRSRFGRSPNDGRPRSRSRGRSCDSPRGAPDEEGDDDDGTWARGATGAATGAGATGIPSTLANECASSAAVSRSPSMAPISRRASALPLGPRVGRQRAPQHQHALPLAVRADLRLRRQRRARPV